MERYNFTEEEVDYLTDLAQAGNLKAFEKFTGMTYTGKQNRIEIQRWMVKIVNDAYQQAV